MYASYILDMQHAIILLGHTIMAVCEKWRPFLKKKYLRRSKNCFFSDNLEFFLTVFSVRRMYHVFLYNTVKN